LIVKVSDEKSVRTEDGCDQRRQQVGDERGDQRREREADDDGNREVDQVAAQDERLELLQHQRVIISLARGRGKG
jgi:hypothetical protein